MAMITNRDKFLLSLINTFCSFSLHRIGITSVSTNKEYLEIKTEENTQYYQLKKSRNKIVVKKSITCPEDTQFLCCDCVMNDKYLQVYPHLPLHKK